MAHVYLRALLLLALLMVTSGCIDTSSVTMSASQEEDVALPCFNSSVMDPKSCYRVKWTKSTHQTKVILARPKTSAMPDVDRAKWEADRNGQMSLFLTKLQKSDEGQYSCEIWHGWDCIFNKTIFLKVKECQLLPAVKVKLSNPVCLNCPVDTTDGSQNISWVILKGNKPAPVNSDRVEINGTSLAIQSMSSSDSGWYRCMLGQTQRCFDINLQVQETAIVTTPALTTTEISLKPNKEESSGAFIPVVVSVTVVIAIIAALMGLFIYRRRNTQRVTQRALRRPTGTQMMSSGSYEEVDTSRMSEDFTNQRINSMYHFQDESLCTFHY